MIYQISYNLDFCNICGDNVGEVEMQVHFDENNQPMTVEALEDAKCSCERIKVEDGGEYRVLEHSGEYPDVTIEAIGGKF